MLLNKYTAIHREGMDPSSLTTPEGAARLTCFYHGGCPDGVTGAWALYRRLPAEAQLALQTLGGPFTDAPAADPLRQLQAGGPVFHGIGHDEAPPPDELVAGRDVVYVDIMPRVETLTAVARIARTTTVLDHHRSAKAAYTSLKADAQIRMVYDEARSGAQIAWDWATDGAPRWPTTSATATYSSSSSRTRAP
jgi:hypothetical protein